MRRALPLWLGITLLSSGLRAQEPLIPAPTAPAPEDAVTAEVPPPGVKDKGIRITFLPPPLQGTLSMAVFGPNGRLVRTLRKQAPADGNFTVGLNGLILYWDGEDYDGKPVAPGKYTVRGYAVASVQAEGEAYLGNDWMEAEDSPRVAAINAIGLAADGASLQVNGTLADGQSVGFVCNQAGEVGPSPAGTALPPSGMRSPGRDGSVWLIETTGDEVEITQYSSTKEPLRSMPIEKGGPVPEAIVAAQNADVIYLLERAEGLVRVRGLALEKPAPSSNGEVTQSTWRTFLSRTLVPSPTLAAAAGKLEWERPVMPTATLTMKLLPNPLAKNAQGSVELTAGVDAKGSFLKTEEGIYLCRLTQREGLKWASLAKGEKGQPTALLQSDGTVVEQYKLKRLAQMMAFDAGEYEVGAK